MELGLGHGDALGVAGEEVLGRSVGVFDVDLGDDVVFGPVAVFEDEVVGEFLLVGAVDVEDAGGDAEFFAHALDGVEGGGVAVGAPVGDDGGDSGDHVEGVCVARGVMLCVPWGLCGHARPCLHA